MKIHRGIPDDNRRDEPRVSGALPLGTTFQVEVTELKQGMEARLNVKSGRTKIGPISIPKGGINVGNKGLSNPCFQSRPFETGKKRKIDSIELFSGVKDNSQVVKFSDDGYNISRLSREQTRVLWSATSNENMILELFWLGRPWPIHDIAQFLRRKRLDLVFLMETKKT
ncbi:hypothetical protein ACFE04_021208 [Oxalis oulophora]